MNDFDFKKSYKKQKLGVHEMLEEAEKAKGGKGGLRSVVGINEKTERHDGPNKGKKVVRSVSLLCHYFMRFASSSHPYFVRAL